MPLPNPDMDFEVLTTLPAESLDQLVENIEALADGTGFNPGAIPASALDVNTNPETRMSEAVGNFVASGGLASFTPSTFSGSITSGVVYINGVRQLFNSLNFTAVASKDRYYYVTLGNTTIQAATDVTNGIASPALPPNSVWLGKIVTNASAIIAIYQRGMTSLGAALRPLRNDRISVGRQDNTTNGSMTSARIETGWGWAQFASNGSQIDDVVVFDTPFTDRPIVLVSGGGDAGNVAAAYGTGGANVVGLQACKAYGVTNTGFNVTLSTTGSYTTGQTVYYQWVAIGK